MKARHIGIIAICVMFFHVILFVGACYLIWLVGYSIYVAVQKNREV